LVITDQNKAAHNADNLSFFAQDNYGELSCPPIVVTGTVDTASQPTASLPTASLPSGINTSAASFIAPFMALLALVFLLL